MITLSRRRLLSGFAGAGGLVALAGRRREAQAAPGDLGILPNGAPRRLVLIMSPNGTQQANFWPKSAAGTEWMSPILSPILSESRLAKKTQLVRGIYNGVDLNGADGNEHDAGFIRMFTGAKVLSIGGAPWAGGASIDHLLGQRWNTEPLNLAIQSSSIEPFPKPGFNHRASFSYLAPGILRTPFIEPLEAYASLFAGELDGGLSRQRARVAAGVAEELTAMRARLGSIEKAKLEGHAHAVLDLQRRLSKPAGAPVNCGRMPKRPRSYDVEQRRASETDIPELAEQMVSLITGAFACGVSRIATLQIAYGGGKWMFDWEGVSANAHDALAHRDTKDEGADPKVTAQLIKVHRFYARQVAALGLALDNIPEADGTMLDHTLIVWTSELGRGDHNMNNIPLVLLGGGGFGTSLGTQGKLIDEGRQTFQRVGCTILRAMGESAEGFGDEPKCGALSGIRV
jgi:Protein of unknown function (DUF1552)